MTHAALVPPSWIDALVFEAGRDLVFAWHITQGCFGGPVREPRDDAGLLRSVAQRLLERGCFVGFGDPDADDWRPLLVEGPPTMVAEHIAAQWATGQGDLEFLVFAKREAVTPKPTSG